MRPRFGTRGLPPEVYASWRRSLSDRLGVPVRILAWAPSGGGHVVGSPAVLSVGDGREATDDAVLDAGSGSPLAAGADDLDADERGEVVSGAATAGALAEPQLWRHIGWHEIEHGGWNAESRSLSWTLYGGRRGRVALAEPGRLPELFRERVSASIAVERFVPLRGERGVTVTARRELGASGEITWHSSLTRGLSWSTDGVAEEAARASAALQSEYGSTSPGW